MLARILPLVSVLALIAFFVFIVHVKRTRNIQYLQWNKKTSVILGIIILVFHIAFTCYYAFGQGVYLYLLHSDLCTMLYPWISICLFFNFRKMLTVLMPLAITGGFFEQLSQKMFFGENSFEELASWIKHIALIITGIYILINEVNYKWKSFGYSICWILGFILYIIVVDGIPFWVTHDPRFGTFSMGIIVSSYWEVQVSWTNKNIIAAEYKVLSGFGYPFGTIALLIMATLFSASAALGTILTSRYIVKENRFIFKDIKRLIRK